MSSRSIPLLLVWLGVACAQAPPRPPTPPPSPFVAGPNGVATVLPPDLRPDCAQFDSARNVLVSRFDSSEATGWRDVQFGPGRDQAIAFEGVEGTGFTTYSLDGYLDLTATAGVMTNGLRNWSTDPAAPFTVIVVQSLNTQTIDWGANYLIAEMGCSGSGTASLLFGTREAYIAGVTPSVTAFHTSKPVPVEPGWNLHAFVRRKGGTEGAYYYAGASGGIALREAFTGQPPIAIGPNWLTVGTSRCMATAKSRTQLGAVLVYNRALSVTDLKRVHESYAPRFNWTRGGGSPVCLPGISIRGSPVATATATNATVCLTACNLNAACEFSVFNNSTKACLLRRNAVNGTEGASEANATITTCFSRPNYGNYYCVRNWDIAGTNMRFLTPADKSTCLGACDATQCQYVLVAVGSSTDCIMNTDIFSGANGVTQPRTDLGAAFEACIKARVYPRAVECGKWTKGGPGETRLQRDCDGDGLLDAVLVDASGARGVALSSKGCSTEDADTGHPDAPTAACPAVFNSLCPKPPDGEWCSGGEVVQLDCARDAP
ncbi:hypothetical protein HYH03_014296 [Edaphochlamys debaryana]|uniref:Apple domain-containing protein n=1 Tax=Edaphochlamys debaryana TaxID=47281 RepID=A0A835XP39_9CHLO|nr:hypothetical protein HYH03_014296 [Edaphochlamys debaryana]|eukprot:KAG2487050.1 hypothetical protein HYH03_014296 [Edaphochlamys debaryana]